MQQLRQSYRVILGQGFCQSATKLRRNLAEVMHLQRVRYNYEEIKYKLWLGVRFRFFSLRKRTKQTCKQLN